MDKEHFNRICRLIMDQERMRTSIGTLSEKTIHAVLKNYYEPNLSNHEIPFGGFVTDIFNSGGFYEIQTGNFNKLRRKLDVFLSEAPVTIIYPIPYQKWLLWINEETGEVTDRRKSPKTGTASAILPELYKIKSYLLHPNLHLRLVFINMEEYRLLNGWSQDKKKGSTRHDRFPVELVDEIDILCLSDYAKLLPAVLPEVFTSADYRKAARISQSCAQTSLNILAHVGAVVRIGKSGNSILYQIS